MGKTPIGKIPIGRIPAGLRNAIRSFLLLIPLSLAMGSLAMGSVSAQVTALDGIRVASRVDVKVPGGGTEEGRGIKVRSPRKNVLFGNAKRSKTPAVLDYKKALAATPEFRKIREDGIDKDSAEYAILKQKAVKRLKKVIVAMAVQEGRDCVVKKGAIRSKGDREVADLTSLVVSELESADLD